MSELVVVPRQRDAEADARIDALEAGIRDLPRVELRVRDFFSKGVYARELFIPKNTVLTGKIHKFANLNILSQGSLTIRMEDGVLEHITAPYTVVSPPGTRRVAMVHEDTIWTTIHGTDKTDVDAIEEEFIAQTPADYQLFCEQFLKLGG